MTNSRSAADLLLFCLSASREPSAVSRTPTADWNEVINLAVHEHVAPLLFKRLKESDVRAHVPADAWKRLRRAYFTSGDRNTRLYRELGTVLRCLRSAGVKVIVLKGAFLAEAVYGDVALRPMCDNDLMVPRAELARAEAVLLDLGHGHQQPEDIESLCRRGRHLPPVAVRGLAVEIRWTIATPTGPFRIDAAGLWDRAHPATIAGVEVLALSPEDLLLHVCLHASVGHGLGIGVRPFCDIAETIHRFRSEMDWAQVVERAREWDATRYVGLTLHLARSLLAVPVPEDVLVQLVPEGLDSRMLKQATECVLAEEPCFSWAVLPFSNRFGDKSTWEKVKALWGVVFLSRDQMALRYPRSRDSEHLWPYYVLRLVDLPHRYGRATLQQAVRMMRFHKRESTPSLARWLRSGKQ